MKAEVQEEEGIEETKVPKEKGKPVAVPDRAGRKVQRRSRMKVLTPHRDAHKEPPRRHLDIMAFPRSLVLLHPHLRVPYNGLPTSPYRRHRWIDHRDLGCLVFVQAVLPCKSSPSSWMTA